jgi:hypothetical protein
MDDATRAVGDWAHELSPGVVARVIQTVGNDGYGVYEPAVLEEAGIPPNVVATYARVHRAVDADPRQRLRGPGGVPVAEVAGVYALELLLDLARGLGYPAGMQPSRRLTAYEVAVYLARWVRGQGHQASDPCPPLVLSSIPPAPIGRSVGTQMETPPLGIRRGKREVGDGEDH